MKHKFTKRDARDNRPIDSHLRSIGRFATKRGVRKRTRSGGCDGNACDRI